MSADPAVNGMSRARAAGCLGLLSRGCCVHYSGKPERRVRRHAVVAGG
jgi:hypothetical protein